MRVSLSGLLPGPRAEQLLTRLRPDFAKLDCQCVPATARATSDGAAGGDELRTLVDSALAVGATVIATGIESPEDLKVAQASGASLYSGFLLCRPRRL